MDGREGDYEVCLCACPGKTGGAGTGVGGIEEGRKRWRRPCNYFFPPLFPARKFAKVGGKDGGKKKRGPLSPFFAEAAAASPQGAARQKERRDTSKKKGGGDAHDLSHVHKPPSQQVFSSPFPSARLFPVTNFPPREGERQKRSEKMGTRENLQREAAKASGFSPYHHVHESNLQGLWELNEALISSLRWRPRVGITMKRRRREKIHSPPPPVISVRSGMQAAEPLLLLLLSSPNKRRRRRGEQVAE